MDEREFLEELEHLDAPAPSAQPPHMRERLLADLEEDLPVATCALEPEWAFDAPEPNRSRRSSRDWFLLLLCGFVVGAAAAVAIFHDRVTDILTRLR